MNGVENYLTKIGKPYKKEGDSIFVESDKLCSLKVNFQFGNPLYTVEFIDKKVTRGLLTIFVAMVGIDFLLLFSNGEMTFLNSGFAAVFLIFLAIYMHSVWLVWQLEKQIVMAMMAGETTT